MTPKPLGIFASTALLASCAHVAHPDPDDPLESYNRAAFAFNETLDKVVLKPIAQTYTIILPDPVVTGIGNVLGNIGDVVVLGNDLLQGNLHHTLATSSRIVANTVFGVAGIFDVATPLGLPQHDADFGLTLARWGVGEGHYVVLPALGPSTSRDAVGRVADHFLYPTTWATEDKAVQWGVRGVGTIHQRADLLALERAFGDAQIDTYVFQRDAYLQRRRHKTSGGAPEVPPPPP